MSGELQVAAADVTDEWAVRGDARLPASVDVIVIGGGIVGCSAALFLAQRGIAVLLCEKGRIAGEQSGRNWGWVRQQGRSPIELPLMMESLRIWRDLPRLASEDVGFHQGGSLYLAESDSELEGLGEWLEVARPAGLDTRLLTAAELSGVLRSDSSRWRGALYTASDGRAEPNRAAPAIARAASRAGARIASRCAVRGIERSAGRIKGVVTEHGTVHAPTVVCAAGAWTSLFCRSLGVDVPQLRVKGTVARTAPAVGILDGEAWCPRVAIRRRQDGGYSVAHGSAFHHELVPDTFRYARKFVPAFLQEHGAIRLRIGASFLHELSRPRHWNLDRPSPFERDRVLDPAPDAALLREMRVALGDCFPEIGPAPFVESWGGVIESSPDVLPMISPADALPGFFIATGFSGHGFGIGPGAGKLVADMVSGDASPETLSSFRLSRFSDGSAIRPGPTI